MFDVDDEAGDGDGEEEEGEDVPGDVARWGSVSFRADGRKGDVLTQGRDGRRLTQVWLGALKHEVQA